MLRTGLIGFGYWGPILARNFAGNPNFVLTRIADASPQRRDVAQQQFPDVDVVSDAEAVTGGADIDVVVVATPVFTHFDLGMAALTHGKHLWLEKPMASSAEQCRQLNALAAKKNLTLMVDHTFLFTGAVRRIKEEIDAGTLGDIYYFDSVRVNLGLFQHDVNVVWDLAAHDFSIMDYLLGDQVVGVAAHGSDHFNTGMEDIAYVTVFLKDNLIAHFHVNWMAPTKIRQCIVGGSKKMLIWDDKNPDEKIRIYDKGADVTTIEGQYGIQANYRLGDILSPVIQPTEALAVEVRYFQECIASNQQPFNDGEAGLRIVTLLEATDRSLKENGKTIAL